MQVIYYDKTKDCFQQGNVKSWATKNGIDYVLELHRNSASASANGVEVLIHYDFNADNKDKAVLNTMVARGYTNRGFKKRCIPGKPDTNLYNMGQLRTTSIGYSLAEIGFISNNNDNKIFDNTYDKLAREWYYALKNAGVKKLGVICGHGQGDPGACKGSRQEANDVRKIKIRPHDDDYSENGKTPPRKSTFIVGDRVKIINYGNSKPDGTGGQTGGITGNRTVSQVLYGKRYPYKLVAKNGEVGYYDAKALKMIKAMV